METDVLFRILLVLIAVSFCTSWGMRFFKKPSLLHRFLSLVLLTPAFPLIFGALVLIVSSNTAQVKLGEDVYFSVYDPAGVDIFFFATTTTRSSSNLNEVLLQGVFTGLVPTLIFGVIFLLVLLIGRRSPYIEHREKVGEVADNYGNAANVYRTWTEYRPLAPGEAFEPARGCLRRVWIVLLMFLFGIAFSLARYYYDFVNPIRLLTPPKELFAALSDRSVDVALLFFFAATLLLWVYGWLDFVVSKLRNRQTAP